MKETLAVLWSTEHAGKTKDYSVSVNPTRHSKELILGERKLSTLIIQKSDPEFEMDRVFLSTTKQPEKSWKTRSSYLKDLIKLSRNGEQFWLWRKSYLGQKQDQQTHISLKDLFLEKRTKITTLRRSKGSSEVITKKIRWSWIRLIIR